MTEKQIKPLSRDMRLCDAGWIHYQCYRALKNQRRPRATEHDIRDANIVYVYHRKICDECIPWGGRHDALSQ